MKKKIIVSLASFVVLCIAIGAISIVKKSDANADSNPVNAAALEVTTIVPVDPVMLAIDTEIPTCGTEINANTSLTANSSSASTLSTTADLENCFPISDDTVDEVTLAKRRKKNVAVTPKPTTTVTSPTTTPVTPTAPVTTPTVPPPTLPISPVVTQPVTPPAAPIQSTGLQWGAFLPSGSASAVTNMESLVGTSMDIRAVFVGWGNGVGDFPDWLSAPLKASGKTLLMYWEPAANGDTGNVNQPGYNYDSIISGKWDSYIASFAQDVKAYGGKVILVPFDEMNGDWYPWSGTKNGNSPAKHNAAYKHLHDIFVAQNVTNVKWGWAPNATSWPNTAANDLTAYYPGDAYVDYVGVDGFNFNSDGWETFSQIFDTGLAKVEQYNKPIYIFSMASADTGDGSKKAAWIKDALTVQMPKHPKIAGFIWFNENKERNWLVDSSPAALAAFKAAVQ